MGFDLSAMLDNVKSQFQTQIDDFVSTGVPAIQSGIEKSAIAWLQKSNEATQSRLSEGIKAQLESPPSEFGKAITEAAQGPILQKYGMQIMLGIAAVGVLGYVLIKR